MANNLSEYLGITDRAVRKQLKTLLEDGILIKSGKPPKVFYSTASPETKSVETTANTLVIGEKVKIGN